MSNIGDFQDKVNDTLGSGFNFRIDRAHDGKPEHIDITRVLSNIDGADKAEVDFEGNVLGGSTHIGPIKMDWY